MVLERNRTWLAPSQDSTTDSILAQMICPIKARNTPQKGRQGQKISDLFLNRLEPEVKIPRLGG